MFLQRLREYGERLEGMRGMPPPMYQRVPIRYLLRLDATGHYLLAEPIDLATAKEKGGPEILAPKCVRTSGAIRPQLLADDAEYTLGIGRATTGAERLRDVHLAYVTLVKECAAATGEPSVVAVAAFLESLDVSKLGLPPDLAPKARIMFTVELDGHEEYPINLPSVRAFWANYAAPTRQALRRQDAKADALAATLRDDEPALAMGDTMQCLVCGQIRPAVRRLAIQIKGIPGPQSSRMVLISANKEAFWSFGVEESLISPTCEECGQFFGNALNHLLADPTTHLRADPVAYIFWAREDAPFSLATLLANANPDEVRRLFTAPWHGRPDATYIETMPYYAAALSASGARVVLREWIETTLGEAQRHLTRYFQLMRLTDFDGQPQYFPLRQLARATINAKSKKEEPAPQVAQSLLHAALHGGPLPEWLLFSVVRRTRAEQSVSPAHAALIKMVWLSDPANDRGETEMTELDPQFQEPAYLCGRLLAVLEEIQRSALGDVNATIVDRYFGTASSAPASVFGRLLRGSQPHLAKLRREREATYVALDRRLGEVMEGLSDFPHTLTLQQQGLFALGFYHQKAASIRAARERKAQKVAVAANGAATDD